MIVEPGHTRWWDTGSGTSKSFAASSPILPLKICMPWILCFAKKACFSADMLDNRKCRRSFGSMVRFFPWQSLKQNRFLIPSLLVEKAKCSRATTIWKKAWTQLCDKSEWALKPQFFKCLKWIFDFSFRFVFPIRTMFPCSLFFLQRAMWWVFRSFHRDHFCFLVCVRHFAIFFSTKTGPHCSIIKPTPPWGNT